MEITSLNNIIKSIGQMDLSFFRIRSSGASPSAVAVKDMKRELQILTLKIQEALQAMNFSLKFILDAESEQVIMKVVNQKGEVIREIPPEEQIRLARNLPDISDLLVSLKEE